MDAIRSFFDICHNGKAIKFSQSTMCKTHDELQTYLKNTVTVQNAVEFCRLRNLPFEKKDAKANAVRVIASALYNSEPFRNARVATGLAEAAEVPLPDDGDADDGDADDFHSHASAEEQLEDAEEQLEDAEEQLEDAEEQLEDAEEQLDVNEISRMIAVLQGQLSRARIAVVTERADVMSHLTAKTAEYDRHLQLAKEHVQLAAQLDDDANEAKRQALQAAVAGKHALLANACIQLANKLEDEANAARNATVQAMQAAEKAKAERVELSNTLARLRG